MSKKNISGKTQQPTPEDSGRPTSDKNERATRANNRRQKMELRTTDNRGRVSLGTEFAHKPITIKRLSKGRVELSVCEAVPIEQAWLLKNKEALNLLEKGLEQARNGETAQDPTVGEDFSWLDDVEEDEDGETVEDNMDASS